MTLLGRMRTRDGVWAVEAHRVRAAHWYRITYLGAVWADRLSIAEAQRRLREVDVDWADLIED